MKIRCWFCQVIIYFFITTVHAKVLDDKTINSKEISQFKSYLRTIQSIAIDFTQEDSRGNRANGKLLINKPHKFLCNYYSPFPLVIIGNKNYVSIYDYDMEHVSRIKPVENIFNFLLEDTINCDKYLNFESIIDQDNIFAITIYHTLSERRAKISFNKNTRQITMIELFENDNIITIKFNNIIRVQNFEADLFKLKNPDIFGVPSRLSKADIEKKYTLAR